MSFPKQKRFFVGLTRNIFLLTFTSFFADISTEMLYPILPIFITQVLFAPAVVVGLIEGVATAMQYIVQGFSGWLADKIQNNKKVALFGYGVAAIAKPSMGLSINWGQLLLGRALDRFGTGMRSAPRDGLIANSVSEQYRGKAFGLEGVGDNMGAVIGPLVTIPLFFVLRIPIRTIFYLAFLPGFLAFVMILSVKQPKKIQQAAAKFRFNDLPIKYWKYIFAVGLAGIGNSTNAFLILQARNIGVPLITTIGIYAAFNLAAALASYPAGSLSDTFGRKNILLASLLIFAVTYLGFSLSSNVWLIGFLFILYGVYQGIFRAVGKAMATDFIPANLRPTGIGIYSAVIGLTGLLASVVGGVLWDKVNPSATFLYGAVFAVLGLVALFVLTPHHPSSSRSSPAQ